MNQHPDCDEGASEKHQSQLAVASIILGILGIISTPLMFFGLPELFDILAIIFGVVSLKQAEKLGNKDRNAVIGLALGIAGCVLLVMSAIVLTVGFLTWIPP